MCGKKKCTPFYLQHPLLCGMIAGFAVIGMCGVLKAVKSKAKRLGNTAKQLGCDCMESVKEKAEELVEGGMNKFEGMMHGSCTCGEGTSS